MGLVNLKLGLITAGKLLLCPDVRDNSVAVNFTAWSRACCQSPGQVVIIAKCLKRLECLNR
jgi:hypothetical protein